MNKNMIIVLGGEISVSQLKDIFYKTDDPVVIAADRGLEALDKAGIKPDVIMGDFDSVDADVLDKYRSDELIRFDSVKDFTDGEAAVDMAVKSSSPESKVIILGGTGGRMDHALANLSLMKKFCDEGISAEMLDTGNRIRVFKGPETIEFTRDEEAYKYISLIPLGDRVSGVNIKGFKYDADGITLIQGSSLGVSNELISDNGSVIVDEGYLIVIETM